MRAITSGWVLLSALVTFSAACDSSKLRAPMDAGAGGSGAGKRDAAARDAMTGGKHPPGDGAMHEGVTDAQMTQHKDGSLSMDSAIAAMGDAMMRMSDAMIAPMDAAINSTPDSGMTMSSDAAMSPMDATTGNTPDAGMAMSNDAAMSPMDATVGNMPDAGMTMSNDAAMSPMDATVGNMPDAGMTMSNDAGTTMSLGPLCASCGAGAMLCNGQCVWQADPLYGCGTCSSCSVPSASAKCSAQHTCTSGVCSPGWADCDGNPNNDCEANLSNPSSCGTCNTVCSGSTSLCSPTGCVAACSPPLTKCGNSCVDLTKSATNCGGCGGACPAFYECNGGSCTTPTTCPSGLTLCGTSCVDLTNSAANCGACGNSCASCANSVCIPVQKCDAGLTFCGSTCVATQTDTNNCGGCAQSCGSNQFCAAGACTAKSSMWLATGLSQPTDIVSDGANIYWSDIGSNTINWVPIGGGAVTPLAQNQSKPLRLAVDATHVYWSNNLGGAIMRALKDGTGTPEVVTAATSPSSFALDSQYVYFSVGDTIQRVLKTGGTPTTFVTVPARFNSSDAVDAGEVFSDGTALYVVASEHIVYQSYIEKIVIANGAMTGLADVITSNGVLVAFDAPYICFKTGTNLRGVSCIDTLGGAGGGGVYTTLDNSSLYGAIPTGFVGTACGVFWASGGIYFKQFGSAHATLLASSPAVTRIILQGNSLYWTDTSGAIGRLPVY